MKSTASVTFALFYLLSLSNLIKAYPYTITIEMSRNTPPMANGYLSALLTGSGFNHEVRLNPMKSMFSPGQVYTYFAEVPLPFESISQVKVKYDRGGPYDAQAISVNRLSLQQNYGSRLRRSFCGSYSQMSQAGYYSPLYVCY